ncbi:Hypothetical_protein [Hexamita inflata]|uniref:Hypothetical_protein n=1 Tax=Hexamita inflata TaxID=28002 RepID=A0AA86P3U0_9EUKA|nr:Hypothetical protein HINF_LOCUS8530 [Hexamita inflata]CAI9930243.1 Hypothetical protein HINF_LOCUS17888 [Hexamita inflata]CAI9939212.1 Hypothetical protein HINF_LOCUS26857 [Hexamita inflata]
MLRTNLNNNSSNSFNDSREQQQQTKMLQDMLKLEPQKSVKIEKPKQQLYKIVILSIVILSYVMLGQKLFLPVHPTLNNLVPNIPLVVTYNKSAYNLYSSMPSYKAYTCDELIQSEQLYESDINLQFHSQYTTFYFNTSGYTSFELIFAEEKIGDQVWIFQDKHKMRTTHFACTNTFCQFRIELTPLAIQQLGRNVLQVNIKLQMYGFVTSLCTPVEQRNVFQILHREESQDVLQKISEPRRLTLLLPVENQVQWGTSKNIQLTMYRFANSMSLIGLIVFGCFLVCTALVFDIVGMLIKMW